MKVPPYSTSEGNINLPEYGRNIQKMVEHAMTLPSKEDRQLCANQIINIMGNLFPHLRNVDDFNHKLWDHLAIISDNKLDIDYPFPIDTAEKEKRHTIGIPYSNNRLKYPQYGFWIEKLVETIMQEEETSKRNELIRLTLFQMKKIYQIWNRDGVDDEIIIEDLRQMTKNKVEIPIIVLRVETPKANISKRKNKH